VHPCSHTVVAVIAHSRLRQFPAGSSQLSKPNRVHLSLRSIWFSRLLPTPPHGDAVTSSSRRHIGCRRPRSLTLEEDTALQRTGTPVARCPPRRSRRAKLPHRAPRRTRIQSNAGPLFVCLLTSSCRFWGLVQSGSERLLHHLGRRKLPSALTSPPDSRRGSRHTPPSSRRRFPARLCVSSSKMPLQASDGPTDAPVPGSDAPGPLAPLLSVRTGCVTRFEWEYALMKLDRRRLP
jgi:hypothetical protein